MLIDRGNQGKLLIRRYDSSMHQAERGLFDLQQGRSVYISTPANGEKSKAVVLATVEGLTSRSLDRLTDFGSGRIRLSITGYRAEAMGLLPRGSQPRDLSLGIRGDTNPESLLCVASATGDHSRSIFDVRSASAPDLGVLASTPLGRLLPAVISIVVDDSNEVAVRSLVDSAELLAVTTSQIEEMANNISIEVTHVSEGPVPLEEAEDAQFMVFREGNGILEHVAILIGNRDVWPDPVPVRIHSACLTGDLFGSLRCDCGEQLRGSLRIFSEAGGGVLLYLAQEGRGIGLANKLRAYNLQQEGFDTVDADCTLGFGADERGYNSAVEMLRHLKIDRICLLTNNPEKVRAVREGGIQVVDRQPLYGTLNRHNFPYVKAKIQRAGHWLGEMISGAVPGK